jgi:eukaryotic-like serine/threonine-protein kinase
LSQSKTGIPEPTEIAGRYQVVQKLGAGAFGTVYKAKDKILGRHLAIKTIRLEGLAAAGAGLEEMLNRFKREAEVSAQLKHPNIVTIYDIGEDEGMSYLAMEFIDGKGLERLILDSGRLPLDRAASIGAQVADALDFAHKGNVVHRDIKPANIMIEAGDRVKVTDFGIARLMDSGEHLTMTGSLLGTPSYMSPEQARGGAIDGRSDLFSLGCVVYEMLAGKKAFRGESITALIFKIITEEPPPIRDLDPDLPDELVRIVTKAIAKNADQRYQSGEELKDDLLALTRAGSSPTIRQIETPTAPGTILSPTVAPTLKSGPLTMTSAPTLNTPPAAAGAPPTVLSAAPATRISPPPTPRPGGPPPPPVSAPQRGASMPAPRAAAARQGGGAGLLIGLAVAGLLFVGVAAAAGWYFFLRKPVGTNTADGTPATTLATTVVTEPTATTLAVVAPPSTVTAVTSPTTTPNPPTTVPTTAPPVTNPGGKTGGNTGGTRVADGPGPTASTVPRGGPVSTGGTDLSFLDSAEPVDGPDGREVGGALSDAYTNKQGGSGSTMGSGRRFNARLRNPRPGNRVELAAIKTVRYIMNNQEMYKKENGHYGSLKEVLAQRPLDVTHNGNSFRRNNYQFSMEVSSDTYKVTAMPIQPGPRPFVGDDSGFIEPQE